MFFRFSPEEDKKRHPFSFLPFDQGPRICPGLKLANLQAKIAVIKLLQRFEIKPCSQTIVISLFKYVPSPVPDLHIVLTG
jgi:cytochrome P450